MMTKRETVNIDGRWVKSVKWIDGPGWRTKSVEMTRNEREAATFIPEAAAAIRKAYSLETRIAAQRNRAEVEQAAARILAEALADAMGRINPKWHGEVRNLVKGL
jgi:hypothetical protein